MWLFPHQPQQFPHLPWTSSTGRGLRTWTGDKSHNLATSTLLGGGISQLLLNTWISPQAPKSGSTCLRRGTEARGEHFEAPLELGWGRGTMVPQQSCQASLQLGSPQADLWRQWKLKWHRKHPNEGLCITANCSALPNPSYSGDDECGLLRKECWGRGLSLLFPFKIPPAVAELAEFAQAACKFPTTQQLTLMLAPHPRPWEQHSHVPPAARKWAEMGCGQEQAQSLLLPGYQVKSSAVNGGGNL